MKNHLIVIENGKLQNYPLDNKLLWEIGRPSKENHPGYPDVFRHCQQKTWKIQSIGTAVGLCGRLWKKRNGIQR